ncbi:transcriptional regulator with XRE-family HTH domain [Streptomyces sp. LBL]|uniref:Scr1 family TA system antitoxin-like transcriptional regulator n=1 Tax=Streptomyces sp. LBL TaxID=2940562 RepID=UPI002475AF3B|nr:Scr1 family TA system antitoxin-like transcriptional regulator [Streptomyces sp. LBL]MDH6625212.1 transcriptional regulator with XRE-family HTH domain [Streptomyces sp. LBL]
MAAKPNPTARQARLGAELRKLREAADVSNREAAEFLNTSPTQISHIEAGRFGISEERLRRLAEFYAAPDRRLVDALVEMANDRSKGWWENYRGVVRLRALDLAELEHRASYVRTFQVVHIPGVLQTEEYVRAASLFVAPDRPESDREAHVAFRMHRQTIVESGMPYDAIIHEAALRMHVGGPQVARAQLEYLLRMSDRANITIRVIPFVADGFAGAGFPMQYVGGVVPQLDTVQIDTTHGAEFIDAPAQLIRYRDRLERVDSAALPQEASLDLVRRIAQGL